MKKTHQDEKDKDQNRRRQDENKNWNKNKRGIERRRNTKKEQPTTTITTKENHDSSHIISDRRAHHYHVHRYLFSKVTHLLVTEQGTDVINIEDPIDDGAFDGDDDSHTAASLSLFPPFVSVMIRIIS